MEMMEETEEQTTYSVTLESLLHAQSETNGEAGGGGTDGESGGGESGTGGETEQKETASDERCPPRYDISYNVTLTTTNLTGTVSAEGETNALLKKLLAALKVKFGADVSGQLATTAALSGNLATYEIR